jgi:hypothetical protein
MASEKLVEGIYWQAENLWRRAREDASLADELTLMDELRQALKSHTDRQMAALYPKQVQYAVTRSHWDRIKPDGQP